MGQRTILVRSDYSQGDITGPFKTVSINDTVVDSSGTSFTSGSSGTSTPDTYLPFLSCSSNSTITIEPVNGVSVKRTFQDGIQRTITTSSLVWNFANGVADLGLDVGAEAASTWYYLYEVPKSDDDTKITYRASITAPITGSGPTGYTNFNYVGSFRNNASSNILWFYHMKNVFYYGAAVDTGIAAGGIDVAVVTLSVSSSIPRTAGMALMRASIKANVGGLSEADIKITGQGTAGIVWANENTGSDVNFITVVTPNDPKTIDYQRVGPSAASTLAFYIVGWHDRYL